MVGLTGLKDQEKTPAMNENRTSTHPEDAGEVTKDIDVPFLINEGDNGSGCDDDADHNDDDGDDRLAA